MNIIDVTLRDGGHLVDFDWDIKFAKEYYQLLSSFDDVDYIELGYWKQTEKSENDFYNLDFEKVKKITNSGSKNNVSIMIDYHYCSHNVNDYPTIDQNEIAMIRLCSRKEDIDNALEFGQKLKRYSGLNVSFNVFNASNYTEEELDSIAEKIGQSSLDYIYFADTHGTMDMEHDFSKFVNIISILKKHGKKVGFHLHDHNGKGYFNYRYLLSTNIDSLDTSVRGMGKGSGNLKLEFVLSKDRLHELASLINKYQSFLKTNPTAYELITSKYGITDNYAKFANEINMDIDQFDIFCSNVKELDRDTYNENLFEVYES